MSDRTASDWRGTLKRRLFVAFGALTLWAVAIEARLVHLQVIQYDELAARAEGQHSRTRDIPEKRGEILDRYGRVLAYSVDAESIYAVPPELGDPDQAAAVLCRALRDCTRAEPRAIAERIRNGKHFAYVRRLVSPEQARRVAALELKGIGFMPESRRHYPNRELASHLLGYVGFDSVGLGGIESTYDSLIKGNPGRLLVQIDARRRAFSRIERPSTAGADLELTIDRNLQFIVERELHAGIVENRARAGSVVVLDPRTGEILAMANWPTFNPNIYRNATDQARRNRSVQDLYEPGSIFKIVTASAALEQNLIAPGDLIDARGGTIRVGPHTFKDTHDYGVLSFTDAIVKSSNVGAIKVGLRLGGERLVSYVTRFGFGRQLSPDFPGESPGIVWQASRLTDGAIASVSMGYQVGVTPLQMAAAVSAVANGGELVQPRAVRAVVRDGRRTAVPRKVLDRAVSGAVAAELTTIMEEVVARGTGTPARIEGQTVAGKTGTAIKLVKGSYRGHSEYNASFVGFLPSRDPVFTIVVAIDSPHGKNGYYGGPVAAPIFQRIASAALRLYGVPRTIDPPDPVFASRWDEQPDRPVLTSARLSRGAAEEPGATPVTGFPDLTGLSARDAAQALSRLGVTFTLRGSGLISGQSVSPGTPFDEVGTVLLTLDRQPVVAATPTEPEGS